MKKTIWPISSLLCIICIFLCNFPAANNARAWTEPRQLTNDLAFLNPLATCFGRNLYVVGWTGGGQDFSFLRSWNSGFSWLEPIQPADTFYAGSDVVDIEYTSDNLIHVVWEGWFEGGNRSQLFHQSSSDNGMHWSNRHHVFNNSDLSLSYPRLASKGDTLFLVYTMGGSMYFCRSFDCGLTWEQPRRADTAQGMSYRPTILYSQGRLHLVYQLNISDGGIKIYYSRSDDFGLNWTPRIYLSSYEPGPPFYASQFPSAYADENGHIASAWFDYQYGSMCGVTGDILARISIDNGDSWLPEARLTYTQSGSSSSCLILNDIIYIAWEDSWQYGCDYSKIVISSSDNWGGSWSQAQVMTGPEALIEHAPFLLHSFEGRDTVIHCFYDIYNPSSDLYYVRSKPYYSDRMVLPGNIPVVLKLKAYPNVFNSSTLITFDNSEGGDVQLEIFDVNGKKVWSRCVFGKEGSIVWDAIDNRGATVCSGIYFVRAQYGSKATSASQESQTIKLIYLK